MFAPIQGSTQDAWKEAQAARKPSRPRIQRGRSNVYNSSGQDMATSENEHNGSGGINAKTKAQLISDIHDLNIVIAKKDTEIQMLQQRITEMRNENQKLQIQQQEFLHQANTERKDVQNRCIDSLQQQNAHMTNLLNTSLVSHTRTVGQVVEACGRLMPRLMPPKPDRHIIVQEVNQKRQAWEKHTGQTATLEQIEIEIKKTEQERYRDQYKKYLIEDLNKNITSRVIGEEQMSELDKVIQVGQRNMEEAKQSLTAAKNNTTNASDDSSMKTLQSRVDTLDEQLQVLLEKRRLLAQNIDRLFPV